MMRLMQSLIQSPVRLALVLAVVILFADQIVKEWMLGILAQNPFGLRVTSFFNIVMVWNRGVSFGLFNAPDAHQAQRWILAVFALVAAIALFIWLRREPSPSLAVAVGLISGGALGNGIDRLRFGAVADFFDFHAFGWHWPAFNVADAAIVLGVAWLLIGNLQADAKAPK